MNDKKLAKELLIVAKELLASGVEFGELFERHFKVVKNDLEFYWDNDGIGGFEHGSYHGYDRGTDYQIAEGGITYESKIPFDDVIHSRDFEWVVDNLGFKTLDDYLASRKKNGKLDVKQIEADINIELLNEDYVHEVLDEFFHEKYNEGEERRDWIVSHDPMPKAEFDGKFVTVKGDFGFEQN